MELDLVPLQNRFNASQGADTPIAQRFAVYEATARELEATAAAVRRQGAMVLDAAVRDVGICGTRAR